MPSQTPFAPLREDRLEFVGAVPLKRAAFAGRRALNEDLVRPSLGELAVINLPVHRLLNLPSPITIAFDMEPNTNTMHLSPTDREDAELT